MSRYIAYGQDTLWENLKYHLGEERAREVYDNYEALYGESFREILAVWLAEHIIPSRHKQLNTRD